MKDTGTKREIKSFWWSPDHPEARWFGTLTLERGEGPQLELIVERGSSDLDKHPLGPVIHGKDEHGKPITLFFAGSSGDTTSGAVMTRRLSAGYALLGVALPNVESFVVNELRVQVQHLHGWLGITGFIHGGELAEKEIITRYRHPEELVFSISADLEIGVGMFFNAHNGFQRESVEEEASFAFRSKAGMSQRRCLNLLNALRLLLHLASLKKVYPVRMDAMRDDYGFQFGERWIRHEVEVWSSGIREAKSEPPIPDHWMFRFEDVRARFADFMLEWLDYTEKFDEALGCYSSTIYHSLTSELAHLSLTQALEAYHGVRFSSHHKQEFQAKITELGNLQAASLAGLVDDVPAFAERVLCNRNYYTHHNPKWLATGNVVKGAELIRLNEKLKLLFQMCVLTDLGIPADRFSRLRRQLATQIIEYS